MPVAAPVMMAVLPARLNIVGLSAAAILEILSGTHCRGLYEGGIWKSINGMDSQIYMYTFHFMP